MDISIDGYEREGDTIFYRITSTKLGRTRVVLRRVREFKALDAQLDKHLKGAKDVDMFHPYIIRDKMMSEEKLVAGRMRKLAQYLTDMQEKSAKAFNSYFVQMFLRQIDLSEKVAIVSGANSGIGLVTARTLAECGCCVIMACRSKERSMPVVEAVRQSAEAVLGRTPDVRFCALDLSSLGSTMEFVEEFKQMNLPLHILCNNAGFAGTGGLTEDGLEMTFAVNHIWQARLTAELYSILKQSAPSRIIFVSSIGGVQTSPNIDWTKVEKGTPSAATEQFKMYQKSKLAMSAFAHNLATRSAADNVYSYHLHPGAVATNVWRELPTALQWIGKKMMISCDEGAQTNIYLSTGANLEQYNGKYFDQMEITDHPHMRADVIKQLHSLTLGDSTISECMGKHLSASPHSAWLPPMNKS